MYQVIADWFAFSVLGLDASSKLGSSINFFIYDILKIYVLTVTVLVAVGFLRTYLSPETVQRFLSKQRFGIGNFTASGFGAVTPFCSCSSIPLFIGFLEAGIPLGIAFSFIITSPLVNEVVFVLMGGLFGWRIAFLYAFSGIAVGVLSGVFIGKMHLEKEIILGNGGSGQALHLPYLPQTFEGKIQYALHDGFSMFRKLWLVIALGIAIGAAIHGYVPQEFFQTYLGTGSWFAVPIAVLIGIPMYAGCSSLVPVVFAFVQSGVPLGSAIAFLMAVSGLSVPEGIMLRRVISTKLLAIFFGVVAVGIIIIGYLFNAIGGF